MNGCIYRTKDNECELWEKDRNCTAFCHPNCENTHPSNADRIRAMTDEELANALHFLFIAYDFREPIDILDWLRQEVAE